MARFEDLQSQRRYRPKQPENPSDPINELLQRQNGQSPGEMPKPVAPGYQERFGDPSKVISQGLPPSLNAPMQRTAGLLGFQAGRERQNMMRDYMQNNPTDPGAPSETGPMPPAPPAAPPAQAAPPQAQEETWQDFVPPGPDTGSGPKQGGASQGPLVTPRYSPAPLPMAVPPEGLISGSVPPLISSAPPKRLMDLRSRRQ